MLKSSLEELKNLNTTLRDEYTALQLAFSALEDKLRSVQVSEKKTPVQKRVDTYSMGLFVLVGVCGKCAKW